MKQRDLFRGEATLVSTLRLLRNRSLASLCLNTEPGLCAA